MLLHRSWHQMKGPEAAHRSESMRRLNVSSCCDSTGLGPASHDPFVHCASLHHGRFHSGQHVCLVQVPHVGGLGGMCHFLLVKLGRLQVDQNLPSPLLSCEALWCS
jgi:hypothetical protein